MKKLPLWPLLFAAFFAQKTDAKPSVLATASMFADIARNIAGDRADVQTICPIGSDPHSYEPTPDDARRAARADLILMNGLTFEGWLRELIENSGTRAKSVLITEGIDAIESADHPGSFDPHAWMSAANGLVYARNIFEALAALMPAERPFLEENFKNYSKKLADLDVFIEKTLAEVPAERRVLITSHDAFHYFGRRYGVRLEAVLGTSTDADVQTADVERLYKTLRETGVPAIFIESTINPKLMQQIASDNGVRIGGELFADSLGDEKSPGATYLEMLRHNAVTIAAALKMEKSAAALTEKSGSGATDFVLLGIIAALLLGSFGWVTWRLDHPK